MSSAPFNLPALGDVNRSLPMLVEDPESASPPPWFGWAGPSVMWWLMHELCPLLRALDLAGYRTNIVDLGLRGAVSGGQDGWLRAFLDSMLVAPVNRCILDEESAVGAAFAWATGQQSAILLRISGRRSAVGLPLAMPVSKPLLPTTPFAGSEGRYWLLSSTVICKGLDALAPMLAASELAADVDQLIATLAERWRHAIVDPNQPGATPDPLDPAEPLTPPGLLWIFDPTFWDSDPPSWADAGGQSCKEMGVQLKTLIDADPEAFLRTQIDNHPRAKDRRAATIAGLLSASNSDFRSREFFRQVQLRNEGLGLPMSADDFENLSGARLFGYRSQVRYLEVLMHTVLARWLPFPALATFGDDFEDENEAFEVHVINDQRIGRPAGVDIRVFDSEPMTAYRVVDLGYPYERCLAWEYKGRDARGNARLVVVAGPGVFVEGQERLLERNCAVTVYRVQDHERVPAWGERIVEALLMAPEDREALYWRDVAMFSDDPPAQGSAPAPDGAGYSAEPQAAFRVQPLPAGCRITYPAVASPSEADLQVDIRVPEGSPYERYSFDIQFAEGQAGERQRYVLLVLATPGVEIGIRYSPGMETQVVTMAWRTRSGDPRLVPPLGEPFTIAYLERVATRLENGDPQFSEMPWDGYLVAIGFGKFVGTFALDVGIGMLPIVGDYVDVAEFAMSFVSGTDKWGQPVTTFDRVMMFGGIVLPFVSSGVLRGVAKAVQ